MLLTRIFCIQIEKAVYKCFSKRHRKRGET